MPSYKFQAKTFQGKLIAGNIDADTEAEARVKIRARKLIPVKIELGGGVKASVIKKAPSLAPGARPKDLQVFTRQLSVLISSGVPLVQALEVLSQSPRGKGLDLALKKIVSDISEGKRLGAAFADHPRVFNRFYVNMLIAGEEGGVLDQVLARLAEYIEKSVKLQAKIKGAMTYPVVVLLISLAVVTGLLVFVIPKFVEIFKGSNQEIPALTQFVINLSNSFVANWYFILGGFIAVIVGIRAYYQTPEGRKKFDQLIIRVPVFGDFVVKSGMAKFSRTLATLLNAGVSIMEALEIAAYTCGNSLIEKALLKSRASVAKGKLLSLPLSQEKFIPHMVVQMIAVGEQTGALDEMLNKVADFYEDEVDVAVSSITSLMEPLMIVVLGGIVAFFVVAMYLPIFNMAGGV
ncbi:MAG: type II secretion system F family protein [Bdellovibrionales bacterium]|nr:type II secretion system F family protein [Bdellovibrionales bacterium]